MDPTTQADATSPSSADALVAEAMDRVLASERTAQVAIADCERSCAELLEHARAKRRAILERAQTRIVALHTKAAKALDERCAALIEQGKRSAATASAELSDPQRRSAVLERLVAHLTGAELKRKDHGA